MRFVGRVNRLALGVLGDDRDAWLCTRIAGTRKLSSTKYTVTYEFQANETGWERVVAYVEPTTGKPAAKNFGSIQLAASMPLLRGSQGVLLADGFGQDRRLNGLTVVRLQGRADFSELNLPAL